MVLDTIISAMLFYNGFFFKKKKKLDDKVDLSNSPFITVAYKIIMTKLLGYI